MFHRGNGKYSRDNLCVCAQSPRIDSTRTKEAASAKFTFDKLLRCGEYSARLPRNGSRMWRSFIGINYSVPAKKIHKPFTVGFFIVLDRLLLSCFPLLASGLTKKKLLIWLRAVFSFILAVILWTEERWSAIFPVETEHL